MIKKQRGYCVIVKNYLHELIEEVKWHQERGWVVSGSLVFSPTQYFQPMVLPAVTDKD